jgi:hypothetical protein
MTVTLRQRKKGDKISLYLEYYQNRKKEYEYLKLYLTVESPDRKLTRKEKDDTATSLIFKRTRFLGTILYLFIATNILAINIFFHMYIYTLTTIAVCFINCFILLYFEKDKLKSSLNK